MGYKNNGGDGAEPGIGLYRIQDFMPVEERQIEIEYDYVSIRAPRLEGIPAAIEVRKDSQETQTETPSYCFESNEWARVGDHRVNSSRFLLVFVALSFVEGIFAQSEERETKPAAVLELGAAGSWNVKDGRSSFGPDVALEVTPIEKWLEIEIGVTPFYTRRSAEWDTDVLFKKPWDLTRKLELMVGVGPTWVRSKENGAVANSVAIDAAVDFMFWPSERRRFGWFVEPVYEYNLAKGHERSVGISAGLLIAIPSLNGARSRRQAGWRKSPDLESAAGHPHPHIRDGSCSQGCSSSIR